MPAWSAADVEGARARSGGLLGFGGRRLLGVEVVTAVGHQAGQGQEHGHEDARHGQDRPVLATLSTYLPARPHRTEMAGADPARHDTASDEIAR